MTPTRRLWCTLLVAVVLSLLAPVGVASAADPTPAQKRHADRHAAVTLEQALAAKKQWSTYLCSGYKGCKQAGLGSRGYKSNNRRMYWLMYSGHNCTNYAAYRMVQAGLPNRRPWHGGSGNAYYWGKAEKSKTNGTPMVGAVAWWRKNVPGAGSNGHVAYVEKVLSKNKIVISEDSWSGDFHWRRIRKQDGSWPSGFIHFKDVRVRATAQPRIVGVPQVGRPLSLDTGRWTPSAKLTRQWFADGKPVAGATGSSFTPTPAQVHQQLSVRVTADHFGYRTGKAWAGRTARVQPGDMQLVTKPVISGIPMVGHTLHLERPQWQPNPASTLVRWYAGGQRVPNPDGATLRLTAAMVHQPISVQVVAKATGYHTAKAETPRTTAVRPGVFSVTSPFGIEGRTRVGRTLSVTPGSYSPGGADVTYTWLRDGKVIDGADAATYQLTARDLAHTVGVQVQLHRQGYRNKQMTISTPTTVTTRPVLALTTSVDRRKVVVRVDLTAVGVNEVHGPVVFHVGEQELTKKLDNGHARWILKHVDPGRYPVRVDYAGTDVVEKGHVLGEVKVAKPGPHHK